ncbi:MAG: hypothetical protein E7668_02250 [Ruminococcaceae bacterium]|nr:hypothetical protein [Oscillospiraceae bacterium]
MKITKRICCVLLALLMCLPLLVACKNKGENPADTTSDQAGGTQAGVGSVGNSDVTDEVVEYDENGYQKDKLGNKDFGGQAINILGWTEAPYDELDIKYEDIEGSVLGQQVYNRNRRTEARMKVKLVVRTVSGNNGSYNKVYVKECEQAVTDRSVDLFACYSMAATPLMVQGYLANLRSFEVIDFDAPWWSEDLINRASLYDRLYFATGSIAPSFLASGFMTFFNKEMVDQYLYANNATEEFDAEDLYAMVYNDTWTMDNFIKLAKNVTIVGGTKTDTETYGYVCSVSCVDPWYQAADLVTLDNAPDGSIQISDDWNSAKAQDVVSKMYSFFISNSAGVEAHMSEYKTISYQNAWGKGTAMFTTGTFSQLASAVKGSAVIAEKGIGILPMPKYNSDQEEYLSTAAFPFTLYSINRNSDYTEACANVLECMASEGYRLTEPALYDTALKIQSTDSNEGTKDRDMMDVIRDTIRVDVGRLHNNNVKSLGWGMVRNSWYTDMKNNSPYSTYESFFESKRESLELALEQMNETVYNIESVYGN